MTQVVLFHHVLGLTDGVKAFAAQLGDAGHEVSSPDLFDGRTFTSIEDGLAHAEDIGFEKLIEDGSKAVESLAADLVYAGFSMGAMMAHKLAQTRPGARGALLYHHGDVPLSTFGDVWPTGVDVQIHVAAGDEFYEPEVVEEFIALAGTGARAESFVYPGSSHLFADSSRDGYQPESAGLLLEHTLTFLDEH